jgi:hypothetical protein
VKGGTMHEQVQWLLLSQNIGSIECSTDEVTPENKELTAKWIQSVKDLIVKEEARVNASLDVVVLHLQEVGGKKFNKAFIHHLGSVIHQCNPHHGGWCSGLIMPDEDDGITFTAMATVFFVASRLVEVCSLLSFRHRVFVALTDSPVLWVGTRRALFHGAKFSAAGTSRKGYLLTSLRVGSKVFNFTNVHLFHDADNALAARESPSEYATLRSQALLELANEVSPVINRDDPFFVFGDFNFRLDVARIVKALQQQFGQPVVLGKKKVEAPDAVWRYLQDPANWDEVRTFDTEGPAVLRALRDQTGMHLSEPLRNFGPTYLVETEPSLIDKNRTISAADSIVFHRDRFPAWCDRVWMNVVAGARIDRLAYWTASLYPMDHIPVQLRFVTVL